MSLAMKLLIIPLLFVFSVTAMAHEHDDHYNRVNLSASAQTQVENDTVIALLYAQEEGSDAVQLAELVNQRVSEAVKLVKQHDAVKLQTTGYSTSPVYHKNKITGWRVRQNIRLESRDMTLMSTLLGQLQQRLALQSMNFTVSPELRNNTDDELIAEALKVFEQRANNITQQLRRKNYKIVDINVATSANHYPRRNYEIAAMASKAASPSIEAGEQTIQDLSLRVYGATIALSLNDPVPGPFGNDYGSDQHLLGLFATFTGGTQELTFHATGYDIDYADELAVYVNDNLLGYFTVGPNNALSTRDVFTIPLSVQVPGENVLLLRNRTSGFVWGVVDLLLSDQPAPLVITTQTLPDATVAVPYSASLEASGGRGAYTWSLVSGALPLGLTLNDDGSVTGTSTAQGTFTFTARVTDDLGTSTDQTFTMLSVGTSGAIEVPLTIGDMDTNGYGHNYGSNEHPVELYASFTGTGQDLTLYVTGYDIDYADELAVSLNGTLLGHLSVGPNNDVNAGDSFVIPAGAQQEGTNLLHFKVKNNGWTWGITDLLLTDQAAPLTITTTTLPDATATQGYTTTLEASGGRAPYTWSLTLGSLPSGLALNPDGSITGTPTEQGTFDFTARVTDANGDVADRPLSLQAVGTSGTFELVLQVGVMETGEYGWKWGTNEHKVELYASFTGTGGDLTLNVTGYDIDYADELAVYLNGNLIGHLTKGPNNRLNSGDSFSIPATAQLPGTNLLRFKVRNSGWKWGVTDLLLTP